LKPESVAALATDGEVVYGISVCLNPARLAAISRRLEASSFWTHL